MDKWQEEENRQHQEVGAARQKVKVLDDLRTRQVGLTEERESEALTAGRYRALERAFGKDGVPALLIEQALPEIEEKANELLDRLSDGSMSVRFITQSSYKDKKREDLKETLDIQLTTGRGAGLRVVLGRRSLPCQLRPPRCPGKLLARRRPARSCGSSTRASARRMRWAGSGWCSDPLRPG